MKPPVKQQESTVAAAFTNLTNTLNWRLLCQILSTLAIYYYCVI